MDVSDQKKFDRMCCPRGVAVYGGVSKIGSFANSVFLSLVKYGYKGRLFPVSPSGGEVAGFKTIKNLSEANGPIDLASISVPAEAVPSVLEECLDYGVAGVQIHTSGFAETGTPEGEALQRELVKYASKGLKIVGPNCFGIHCPKGGITLLPGFDFEQESGPLAMISQSGGVANDFGHEAGLAGLGISKVVSFGNGCDLDAV
ncbi:MAG: GNAT family N-acetyltransferase, partial [Deltaproteobacteria bacterium]|nr:GNAT family N-acetyltransferase [Deltaproteobacteria bacterium]